jgi:hypothetical protein
MKAVLAQMAVIVSLAETVYGDVIVFSAEFSNFENVYVRPLSVRVSGELTEKVMPEFASCHVVKLNGVVSVYEIESTRSTTVWPEGNVGSLSQVIE